MIVGSAPAVGLGFWSAVAAVIAVLQAVAWRRRAGTLGALFAAVLRPWPVRLVVLALWLYAGWHLFVH